MKKLVVILGVVCAVLSASWSVSAATFDAGGAMCEARVLTGLTFAAGVTDSSGSVSFSFPQPCVEVTYNGNQVVELAMIGVGLTGVPGDDVANPAGQHTSIGAIVCAFKGACVEPKYILVRDAENEIAVTGAVDFLVVGRRVGEVLGLIEAREPGAGGGAEPAAYNLRTFAGLNHLPMQ